MRMLINIFLVLLLSNTGTSRRCYVCASNSTHVNPFCEEKVKSNHYLQECPVGENFCSFSKFLYEGAKHISRSCANETTSTYLFTEGNEICGSVCETDQCNSFSECRVPNGAGKNSSCFSQITNAKKTIRSNGTEKRRCYVCNGLANSQCQQENLPFEFMKDCPSDHFYCETRVHYFFEPGFSVTFRNCSQHRVNTFFHANGHQTCIFTCDEDYCTNATNTFEDFTEAVGNIEKTTSSATTILFERTEFRTETFSSRTNGCNVEKIIFKHIFLILQCLFLQLCLI